MIAATSSLASSSPKDLHAAFLAIVPKIKMRADIAFAYDRCANQKADKVAEAIALAWKWFVKLQAEAWLFGPRVPRLGRRARPRSVGRTATSEVSQDARRPTCRQHADAGPGTSGISNRLPRLAGDVIRARKSDCGSHDARGTDVRFEQRVRRFAGADQPIEEQAARGVGKFLRRGSLKSSRPDHRLRRSD
jgi:hypothetical protein